MKKFDPTSLNRIDCRLYYTDKKVGCDVDVEIHYKDSPLNNPFVKPEFKIGSSTWKFIDDIEKYIEKKINKK